MNSNTSIINKKTVALGLLGASIVIPVMGAGMAHAATESEWARTAQCESSGNWSINTGNGFYGGLQFTISTWNQYGGQEFASRADLATKEQQITVAERVLWKGYNGYAPQGKGAWPACGVGLSNTPYAGTPTPTPTPNPTPTPTPTPAPTTGDKYTVKSGDTLSTIAVAQKVTGGWQVLYAANKGVVGSNPNLIFPGQKLTIPKPVVKYTVKSGDTLSGIASTLKISGGWQALYNANKSVIGSNPNVIKPGMVLVVSGTASAPSTPSTPSTPKPPTTPSVPSSNGWSNPMDVMSITQRYGNPSAGYGLGYHTGIDITRPQGTPVKAVSNATVVHAGYGYAGSAYGLHVVIKLSDGRYALYAHLSASSVRAGQSVTAGQVIGNVGSTGNSSGPHLHFEIRTSPNQYASGVFSDPVTYLRSKGLTV